MTTLIFPGLGGPADGDWQRSWLAALPDARLVEQSDWHTADLDAWEAAAIDAILAHPQSVLVGHGLGATLIARIAARHPDLPIAAAVLVAPVDVDDPEKPVGRAVRFGRMPTSPFPFRAIVVASRNDPHMRYDRIRLFASMWEAQLVDLGNAGHIDAESGYGPWPEGQRLVDRVAARITRPFLMPGRPDQVRPARSIKAGTPATGRASVTD